ncbi:DNA-binding transcriptional regulator, AcrR family [Actinokineospora alba]|uniref:DNA-binding transcriptional regulator, AcrR family n=1 Tax=Actinokineospora alba TaxID=504798 RepID=A0A1H0ILT0_9PSEU|nr:TetR/AcrR family transcriptional regulator [Actinokineospora alba]TDP70890.1 TetR family transcriptional regulator [Actinokineospora alba]SDI90757.1 DNA-binding transcriptional regulator, AcrR family [Actinokineospora alba]SDO32348.1 DNA-binding transcriptional regulator, AcrR family [Actinokineospora alba]
MTPRRLPRAERAAQTREELLAAAKRVFARRGYAGASIADIAEEAGYSHGAVYSNFESKQDLFFALFTESTEDRVAVIKAFFAAAGGTFAERVKLLADESTRQVHADPDRFLLNLEFSIVAARDPALRTKFADRIESIPRAVAEIIAAEQRAGRIRADVDPMELAIGLHALSIGLGIDHWIVPGAVRPEFYGELVGYIMSAISTPPPAAP